VCSPQTAKEVKNLLAEAAGIHVGRLEPKIASVTAYVGTALLKPSRRPICKSVLRPWSDPTNQCRVRDFVVWRCGVGAISCCGHDVFRATSEQNVGTRIRKHPSGSSIRIGALGTLTDAALLAISAPYGLKIPSTLSPFETDFCFSYTIKCSALPSQN
jgi:hypothetical protein